MGVGWEREGGGGGALGHVYYIGIVWEKYQLITEETPESAIPQRYLSRRQLVIDEV